MYCLKCGYKIERISKFCPECGSILEGNVTEENPGNNNAVINPSNNNQVPPGAGLLGGFPMMGHGMTGMPGGMNTNDVQTDEEFFQLMKKINSCWSFEYSTSGMMFRSGVTYKAWKSDDKAFAQVRLSGVDIKDAPIFEVDDTFVSQLESILTN